MNFTALSQIKKMLLGYCLVLILFFAIITMVTVNLIGFYPPLHFPLILGITAIFIGIVLIIKERMEISKSILTLIPPYLLFSASMILKSNGFLINVYTFLTPKIFIILSLMAPIIIYSIREKKKMIFLLVLISPIILFYDYFHSLIGVQPQHLNYDHSYYTLFVAAFGVFFSISLYFLLLFQKSNFNYSRKIKQQQKTISQEKLELKSLSSKLQFQSNMYSILEMTSKNKNLMFILQDVLEQILKIDTLNTQRRGLIFLTNEKNELEIGAHKNIDPFIKPNFIIKGGQIHTIKSEETKKFEYYEIPILSRNSPLGIINIYLDEGRQYDQGVESFLKNVAIILSRKISDTRNKEKLTLRNIEFKNQGYELKSTLSELNKSIVYAQFLQKSLIPNQKTINEYFKDSSFLFKPRDKVSGDFYFAHEVGDNLFFGIGDCTGHGIPGAFLAAMSIEAVKTVILSNGNEKPDIILSKLREVAKERFLINLGETRSDAMDAALCMYDKNLDKLYYSGGFINLLIVRDNSEIIIYNATKCPIGSYPVERKFELNEIDLKKGDVIYLSSDGYVDQFGSDKSENKNKPSKFKRRRFRELLVEISHFSCDEQAHILKKTIKDWRGNLEQTDDITVFIAKH